MFMFFNLSTQNIKFYWCVTKIQKFMLPIWWFNRGSYPLGNKCFGVLVLNGLIADGWAVTIDLYDAYLHVPIHQDSPRLLGFQYLNQTFLYQVLPFGLKDSPGVFHQDSSISNFLRRRGLRIFVGSVLSFRYFDPRLPAPEVLLEDDRLTCLGSKRMLVPLEELPRVCLPSVRPRSKGPRKVCRGRVGDSSSSSSVAKQTVVSSVACSVDDIPGATSGLSGSTSSAPVSSSSSGPESVASYALAALRESGQEAGLFWEGCHFYSGIPPAFH